MTLKEAKHCVALCFNRLSSQNQDPIICLHHHYNLLNIYCVPWIVPMDCMNLIVTTL